MNKLPTKAGIGLKAEHCNELTENPSATGWLEVHPENYMVDGGPTHRFLTQLREIFPLSMHGVGMSLGSANGVDQEHLLRLNQVLKY